MKSLLLAAVAILSSTQTAPAQSSGAKLSPDQKVAEKAAGRQELEEAERLSASAVKLYNEGKYDEALAAARRALEIREKALGPEHVLVSSALINLAVIQRARKKSGEAEESYRRALTLTEKIEGKDSARAADIMFPLALIRYERGDYEEAEKLLRGALLVKEKVLGPEHPDVVHILFNLVEFHLYRGQAEKAVPFFERVVAVLEKQPPKKDTASAEKLSSLLCPVLRSKREETKGDGERLRRLIARLENPEQAAEDEKRAAETGAKPEDGGELGDRAVSKAAPSYPADAKARRAQGSVVVQVVVDEVGRVAEAKAISGHPLLREPAVNAVRLWCFKPTLYQGKPVKVTGTIKINFSIR